MSIEDNVKIARERIERTMTCEECNHDADQHRKELDGSRGPCLASDRLGYSICRCERLIAPESSDTDTSKEK